MKFVKQIILTGLLLSLSFMSYAQLSFAVAQVYFSDQKVKNVSLADGGSLWFIKGLDDRGAELVKDQIPGVGFNYPDTIVVCPDSSLILQADNNSSYKYQWFKNNLPIYGQTKFNLNVLDSGAYKLSVVVSPGDTVITKTVTVRILSRALRIIQSNQVNCAGTAAVLTVNGYSGFHIKWFLNAVENPVWRDSLTIHTTKPGTYVCQYSYPGLSCTWSSKAFTLQFLPVPDISISAASQPPYCQGTPLTLKALSSVAGVHFLWSTGDTTQTIQVVSSGHYSVTAFINQQCPKVADTNINFIPVIPFSLGRDTTLCVDLTQPFILQVPPQYVKYIWNNQETDLNTFTVTMAGTYTLTAFNAQGCSYSSSIKIDKGGCKPPSLVFPTAFTPDGNGINDVFSIKNIEGYPDNEMHIFNRFGNEVFACSGYGASGNFWTGSNLAEGTYYYILKVRSTGSKNQVYKGYITLMRSGQ